ncbi:hypothetical protein BsWGS_22521 [Bradybaena similaris]
MSYYRNVSTSLEAGFEDDDPTVKDNFLNNVFNTLKDEGVQVSQNQTVSRTLEVLFTHSKPHHMRDLFCMFSENLTIVTFDRFASHVFQALLQHVPAIYEDTVATDSSETSKVHTSIEQLCKFAESHMRDVMTHTYASHVLRSLLEALGGVKVKEEVVRSRISRVHCKEKTNNQMDLSCKSLSRDFQQSFSALREKIVRLCNFEDHLRDPSYCPVLQTLLLILHKTSAEEYRSLVKLILDKSCVSPDLEEADINDVSKRLPFIVQNEVGSYLIELIISLAAGDELRVLYDLIFKGKLIYFAVHPIANYVLQKFLSVIVDPVMMKELLTDITGYLEDILAVNHVGIVTKLAQACRNTQTGQEDLIQGLLKAFHCQEPVEKQTKIVPLVASLQTFENFFSDQETSSESAGHLLKTVNIHGSLLLQELLQFTKPKLVVTSLLSLSPAELMGLCCDKCGSHIVDTFFSSQTVLDTNKFTFLKKLTGLYVNIACNRNGSRCLESIWKGSVLKAKTLIAEELSKSLDRIESDQWGHFLHRNFALFKFSQRRKEWIEIQVANTKKQQLLNDILQGKGRKKNKKKQSKEEAHTNETITELIIPEDSKVNRKRLAKDREIEFVSTTEQMERRQQKKKLKLDSEITSTLSDTSTHNETDNDSLLKKKRKRNKKKKKVVRNTDLENSTRETEDSADVAIDKTSKKKKKLTECSTDILKGKTSKKKNKLSECSADLLKDKTSKKKKLTECSADVLKDKTSKKKKKLTECSADVLKDKTLKKKKKLTECSADLLKDKTSKKKKKLTECSADVLKDKTSKKKKKLTECSADVLKDKTSKKKKKLTECSADVLKDKTSKKKKLTNGSTER